MSGQRQPGLTVRQMVGWVGLGLVALLVVAALVWRGDILRAGLDPRVPFQTYEPPPAPDYARRDAWALLDAPSAAGDRAVPVFFVHSTTYDGGREWLGPIGDPKADAYLKRVVLPNHAGPFSLDGVVSAPRYRQASLYARLTLRDDARDARAFAYRDIESAFAAFLARHPEGPIALVGVEQGANLLDRLIQERVAPDAALKARLVGAWLSDVVLPQDRYQARSPVPVCIKQDQAGCVVGWSQVEDMADAAASRRLRRALVWNERGRLVDLGEREAVCVNPVLGAVSDATTQQRRHLGAANATGLEWGVRPAFLPRQVETQCRDGLLRYTRPPSEAFKDGGSWTDRRKARPYNLFYADLEADFERRIAAWRALNPSPFVPTASRTAPPAP